MYSIYLFMSTDMTSKRLYWTDSALNRLKSSKFDGSDVRNVSVDIKPLGNISIILAGIDLYGSYMYVSNLPTGIYRIQKNKINAVPEIFAFEIESGNSGIFGIKIINVIGKYLRTE